MVKFFICSSFSIIEIYFFLIYFFKKFGLSSLNFFLEQEIICINFLFILNKWKLFFKVIISNKINFFTNNNKINFFSEIFCFNLAIFWHKFENISFLSNIFNFFLFSYIFLKMNVEIYDFEKICFNSIIHHSICIGNYSNILSILFQLFKTNK